MPQFKSGKKTIMVFALAFLLPVGLAKLALEYEWFNRGATNKGELLQPVLDLNPLLAEQSPKWRLLYVVPEKCDAACENAMFSIHQVWLALGKQSDRAEPVIVTTDASDQQALQRLKELPHIKALSSGQLNVNESFKSASTDGIFLVDTQNNAMLHYPLQAEQQEAVMHSRDILADLRKLLKLSRIG